jgi:hypothetical protein
VTAIDRASTPLSKKKIARSATLTNDRSRERFVGDFHRLIIWIVVVDVLRGLAAPSPLAHAIAPRK